MYFLPIKDITPIDQLRRLYVREIVRLHGMPKTIVSHKDMRVMSAFWKSLHRSLGTNLIFSITYHLKMNGQMEKTNQLLEDMLRAYYLDHRAS